ncbi:unnamed protein product [Caenorhabditis sp. 36 PRJEB53466]|nr:unnamed protein product [Caenorhabditis sp. 36 PRJEB53466]
MEMDKLDLSRDHPGKVLTLLIATCQKHEYTCQMSVESTANFLSNINELILSFDQKYEYKLLAMVESLSKDLALCKDVYCVMEFEKNHGRKFEMAVQKAGKILNQVPAVEKYAWEHSILQPPPFF